MAPLHPSRVGDPTPPQLLSASMLRKRLKAVARFRSASSRLAQAADAQSLLPSLITTRVSVRKRRLRTPKRCETSSPRKSARRAVSSWQPTNSGNSNAVSSRLGEPGVVVGGAVCELIVIPIELRIRVQALRIASSEIGGASGFAHTGAEVDREQASRRALARPKLAGGERLPARRTADPVVARRPGPRLDSNGPPVSDTRATTRGGYRSGVS
jgi:hypothetical protein